MTFRTTTVLTSLALSLLCFQACGGDEGKKKALAPEAGPDAGMDADADAEPEDASVGSDAEPDAEPDAGPDAAPDADAGPPPGLELLFTVSPGATGIAGTAIADEENPQSAIFASSSGVPDPIEGENQKVVAAADLGILDTDAIGSFTIVKPFPENPMYLFSIEGPEGNTLDYTRTRRSSLDNEPSGDVYFSDGTLGELPTEGGEQRGYNALLADESSLGLALPDPTDGELDNLKGLYLRRADEELTELYFSVSADSTGLAGTAVADTPATERGCTVFRSGLDGMNSVAFTCAQLGLAAGAEIDALAIFGDPDPTRILFSITNSSNGLPGTATEGTTYNGASILESTGDDTNLHTEYFTPDILGLDRGAENDELDGFAVIDQALHSYAYDDTCTLTEDPLTGPGELSAVYDVRGIGANTIILHGPHLGNEGFAAYNANSCAYVGRVDLPSGTAGGSTWAMVPLANWSAATPFTYVEHWVVSLASNDAGIEVLQLLRRNAQGDPVDFFLLESGPADAAGPNNLVYEPTTDRFFIMVGGTIGARVVVVDRPAPGADATTALSYTHAPVAHPCSGNLQIAGPDGRGNMVFMQRAFFADPPNYQACWVSPTVEFALPPIFWNTEIDTADLSIPFGIITPTGAHLLYRENVDGGQGPFQIERALFAPP